MHSVIACPDCGCSVSGQSCIQCNWIRPVAKRGFKTISSVLRQEAAVYGKSLSEDAIAGYQRYLSDYTPEEIERALESIQRDETTRFFPKPGEMLGKLKTYSYTDSSGGWYRNFNEEERQKWSVLAECVSMMLHNREGYERHKPVLILNLNKFGLSLDDAIKHAESVSDERCYCRFCKSLIK